MAIIKPYKALRPARELVKEVASRPYDVLNSTEARIAVKNNPKSFLHITKSEVDLPLNIDVHSTEVYNKAKDNLLKFQQEGVLFIENKPCYYIYELTMNDSKQTGLVCLSSVDDYLKNVIKKHELTRPEKEKDRIDHMTTTQAQTGKVFLTYNNVAEIDSIIERWKSNYKPEYDFTADDGVGHTIWIINDEKTIDDISELFREKVPATYIADGHHRAESAAKLSQSQPDNEEAQYFLTAVFPANELTIMDYNRLVTDLNGLSEDEFISMLQDDFEISLSRKPFKPSQLHEFGMYLNGKWYELRSRYGSYDNSPIGVLDVSILANNILDRILGIKDHRTDKRIDFVGGICGLEALVKRVDSEEMAVAFSLYPVTIQQLLNIADSGQMMPPKSTWFEPKLRDGLLTHLL